MTADQMAALHARCFTVPPPWTASAIAALLDSPHVLALSRDGAFLLGRVVADEAEVLTLAVAPEARRRGLGRALVAAFLDAARARGAARAHLEVAGSNAAARALYGGLGFAETGRRRGYYGAGTDDAVLMTAELP